MLAAIFELSDWLSLHFGMFFILSAVAVFYLGSVLYRVLFLKELEDIRKWEKALVVPASVVTFLFILMLILDPPKDLGPEKTALLFGEYLCAGSPEAAANFVEPNYRGASYADWIEDHDEWRGIRSPHPDEPFMPSISPWLYRGCEKATDAIVRCTVVLASTKFDDEGELIDVRFYIHLSKVPIPARFLEDRPCWRVSSFAYTEEEAD
ncbi:hypothetical protein E3J62_09175 [candidate division TA06 bacterium]|uniref:Uncharacterized protein n=1 Tax=candidate division TA06 bacterium TaxID=2250710 RepID=A0A523UQK0_UNCT6|nr:MAG: hypothetical protein E3J62_09175 [candidate division TA06 bacterium]